MIFLHPVEDGFYHKLTHHRALACRLIAASRTIRQAAVFFLTVKIARNGTFKVTFCRIESMVVDYIHNHTDTGFVKCLHHLLEFFHTGDRLIRVSCVGTVGDIVVQRVISPVVLVFVQFRFIYGSIVIRRKEMDVRHAQFYQMVDAGQ